MNSTNKKRQHGHFDNLLGNHNQRTAEKTEAPERREACELRADATLGEGDGEGDGVWGGKGWLFV